MKLFLVGGAGAGKDTVSRYLKEKYNFHQFAVADYLRYLVKELYGDLDKMELRGRLLKMGHFFREYDEGCLCRVLEKEIKNRNMWGHGINVVISDIRLPYEWKYFFDREFVPVCLYVTEEIRQERLQGRDGQIHPDLLSDVTEKYRNTLPGWLIMNTDMDRMYKEVDLMIRSLRIQQEYTRTREDVEARFQEKFGNKF